MKRLKILAGLCILCYCLGVVIAFTLIATYWHVERILIILMLVFLIAGWLLKKIVNSQEKDYIEELHKEVHRYENQFELEQHLRRNSSWLKILEWDIYSLCRCKAKPLGTKSKKKGGKAT